MINRTAADWQRLQDLPALLEQLPTLAAELAFAFYSFTYSSQDHQLSAGNLPPQGTQLVQAALDLRPDTRQYSNMPVMWSENAFQSATGSWATAYALGLRYGWIQPLHDGSGHSSLTLLRPHVRLSITEHYEKAAWVMWLGERLHLAAAREAGLAEREHGPAFNPALRNRCN